MSKCNTAAEIFTTVLAMGNRLLINEKTPLRGKILLISAIISLF